MKAIRIVFLLSMLFGASAAWSAIQDQGDYLLDTETGFKWIKPTLTRGVSTDQGRDGMTPSGEFASCRYPHDEEVSDLFVKLGLPGGLIGVAIAPEDSEAFEAAINLLGDTHDARLDERADSLDAAPDGAGYTRAGYLNGYAYGIFVSYSDIGPYHVFLRDGEYVDRVTGAPVSDQHDESYAKRSQSSWQPAGSSTGLMMICENWPTLPIQAEILDFENLSADQTAPFTQKGYRVTGDATALDQGSNIIVATTACTDCDPDADFSTSQTITRADGGPFAFLDLDMIDLDQNYYPQGNCDSPGARDLGYDPNLCRVQGVTTWGETVYFEYYPDAYEDEHAYGMGPWLSLQSLTIPLYEVASTNDPQQLAIDNVKVKDAVIVEVDYDPWSTADIIDPTNNAFNAFVMVEISTTPSFDAATVNADSLRLGPARAKVSAAPLTADYDNDGDTDYIFGFRTQDTGIRCIDRRMILEGQTNDGTPFAASMELNISDNCFETVTMDVEPYDANNRLYPDDNYVVLVQLHHSWIEDGDPVDFDANRSAGWVRFGSDRAKNVLSPLLRVYPPGEDWENIYGFDMQDSGIACGDTEVELVGLHNPISSYADDEPFPSGKPAFKATATIQTEDCDTGGCHP
jgi:hypothetical protein